MLQVWRGSLPKDFVVPKSAERILLCGWRRDMEDMIMVMPQDVCNHAPSTWGAVLVYNILTDDNHPVFLCSCKLDYIFGL